LLNRFWSKANLAKLLASDFGDLNLLPLEVTAKSVKPKSMPILFEQRTYLLRHHP
jgi:hypothetical protein